MTDTPAMQSVYPALVARYRSARQWWRQPGIAEAAISVGLDEQEYCRRFVAELGPIGMISMANIAWLEGAAYDEAGLQDARESASDGSVGRSGQNRP